MDLGINGRVALVTGGSQGLGRAAATSLAREGARVAICARGQDKLEETADELTGQGGHVSPFVCDLTELQAPGLLVSNIENSIGPIEILVNNVGGSLGTSDVLSSTEKDFHRVFEVNLWSAVRLMKLLVPGMQERRWGRVINIASIYGREHGGTAPYMAAKASLIAITKHLALTAAPHGVCVNAVAPGSILAPGGSWERFINRETAETVNEFIARNMPIGRFGWPEPVGDTVAFLASECASLIVGACVNVDGGQSHSSI